MSAISNFIVFKFQAHIINQASFVIVSKNPLQMLLSVV